MVIEVISALDVPDVGDEVTTETARQLLSVGILIPDNKMILYPNNVNGELETFGIVIRNNAREVLHNPPPLEMIIYRLVATWGPNFNSSTEEQIPTW